MIHYGGLTCVLNGLKKESLKSEHRRSWSPSLRLGFFPLHCIQDCYSQLHKLTQANLNIEEYTSKFEKLVIKCDLQEPEEQTIVRYLGGLDPKYANVVDLHAYTTFDEVCVLGYKVEQQKKAR